MRDAYAKEIDSLRLRIRTVEEEYEEQISALRDAIRDLNEKIQTLTNSYNVLNEQKILCDARIHAYMSQNGEFTADHVFTDKENFAALEREYQIFNKLFGDEWKKAKKQIRKELLSINNLMPPKEEKAKKESKKKDKSAKEDVSDKKD